MEFSRYHKSNIMIDAESEDVQYRRYLSPENQRFIDYIEGKVETLTQEDFGNITVLDQEVLRAPLFQTIGAKANVLEGFFGGVRVIELSDSIERIGRTTADTPLYFAISDPIDQKGLRVIFPSNLKAIYGQVGGFGNATLSGDSGIVIWDFSKAKQIPTLFVPDSTSVGFVGGTIRVPNKLLTSWKSAQYWSTKADKIVGV